MNHESRKFSLEFRLDSRTLDFRILNNEARSLSSYGLPQFCCMPLPILVGRLRESIISSLAGCLILGLLPGSSAHLDSRFTQYSIKAATCLDLPV